MPFQTPTQIQESLFINGQWVGSSVDKKIDNVNPATEMIVAQLASAGVEDVNKAVQAAKDAFETWGKTSGTERAVYLNKIAEILERDKQELVCKSSLVNGKPNFEAELDIEDAISTFRFYAQQAIDLDERQEGNVPISVSGISSYVRYEPMGVVGLITPWNFPLVTSSWKVAPALAAGCTVVFKPSEVVSFIELELGKAAQEAGLPKGVLNIIPGDGSILGPKLTQHPDVAKISFTGGNIVGEMVMIDAAPLTKNIGLELGGKSPIIVFDDADLGKAVEAVMTGIFFNCGQMCSATSRLIVHEAIAKKLLAGLVTEIERLEIGPAEQADVTMGPMTTQKQYETVQKYFAIAKQEQLDLVIGGETHKGFDTGYFVQPTIYHNVPVTSRLWREEIFGPILCMRTFADEAEAIMLANDSPYGLAGTLCSANEGRLRRVSRALNVGHVWWNMPQVVPVETSWGGFKQSGIGRELGSSGLSAYLEIKHIDYKTKV